MVATLTGTRAAASARTRQANTSWWTASSYARLERGRALREWRRAVKPGRTVEASFDARAVKRLVAAGDKATRLLASTAVKPAAIKRIRKAVESWMDAREGI